MTAKTFSKEADLVAAFCEALAKEKYRGHDRWTVYHETGGFDLLLVEKKTGVQVGLEAKLSLNAKVLDQALPQSGWWHSQGPDYRGVLVPSDGLQAHLISIAGHLGIGILKVRRVTSSYGEREYWTIDGSLPDEQSGYSSRDWPHWLPDKRCTLPDYVPDVTGGHAAPVQLTHWKIQAIKLMVILDRAGAVTRKDMNALKISHSRWTDNYHGFLARTENGYVRCGRTPDLRAQHPQNYAQIEADFPAWGKEHWPHLVRETAA